MIFWKNEMVAHQMVPVVTSIPFGQGWHEDPSGKDCQTRPSPFSTKEEVVTTLLLQLIGGSVCQYMNFVQRM